MSLSLRCVVLAVFSLVGGLFMPPSVSAVDGLPTVFYVYMKMGETTDLVQVETQTRSLTKVMTLDWDYDHEAVVDQKTLPVSIESFLPPEEWQAFQQDMREAIARHGGTPPDGYDRVLERMTAPELDSGIEGLWEVRPGVLLISRRFWKCDSFDMQASSYCYGMVQFSLHALSSGTERIIWTLPFHRRQAGRRDVCYTILRSENFGIHQPIDEVLIHPDRDLIAVRHYNFEEGCPNLLFLIDYSSETAQVTEFSGVVAAAWSHAGRQVAYAETCEGMTRGCANAYGIIDLDALEIAFFKESDVGLIDWVAWPTPNTLIMSQYQDASKRAALVWYDIANDAERSFLLDQGQFVPFVVSLRDDDSHLTIGLGSSVSPYPDLIIADTPGVWTDFERDFMVSRSASSTYTRVLHVLENDETLALLDADLTRYPIDPLLADYRDRYGAEGIAFAFVGASRP